MRILGIDTSTKIFSLGVMDGEKICAYDIELGRLHSSLALPAIKRVIDGLGWRLSDIDYLCSGLGPGSFTGIRVGLSTIKGLGFAQNLPIIGISSLDIISRNASIASGYVAVAVDARRNLVYAGIYKLASGIFKKISSDMLLAPDEFIRKVPRGSFLLGDAAILYKDKFLKKGLIILDQNCWYPKGHNIMVLARDYIKRKKISNAFGIKPVYLYPKECQIRNALL